MKNPFSHFLEIISPYLLIGFVIALFIGLLIVLSYVVIWGVLIGAVIYACVFIKNKFFPDKKKPVQYEQEGRVIEHDDL